MAETYTVDWFLEQTMQAMGEDVSGKQDYEDFALSVINQYLAETFEFNNAQRAAAGKEPLKETPPVESMEDVMPYEYVTMRLALIWAVGGQFFMQDDETTKAQQFFDKYDENMGKFQKARYTPIKSIV